MRPQRRLVSSAVLGLVLLCSSSPAAAQGAASGFELALHGSTNVLEGRSAHFRGVAYRVLGLAKLEPLPGARVHARYATDLAGSHQWSEVRADQRGFFHIEVAMPAHPQGSDRLEVKVGDHRAERTFRFPLSFTQPWSLDLVTDRQLYEPGEKIHLWARLRDVQSLRPLSGQKIALTVTGTGAENRALVTSAAGIATMSIVVPAQAEEGHYTASARIGERVISRSFRIGTRTYERLLTEVKVSPETARPHQPIAVRVKVTTTSGAPVGNASVAAKIDATVSDAVTDRQGVATITMRAPAYMTHDTGSVSILVNVSHPAHGSAVAHGMLRLAVPLTMTVEAVPPNGGLVPELDGLLYIRLSEGSGKPAPAGTPVEVRGAAVRGGKHNAKTDVHGIAAVPTRLPSGAATEHDGEALTTVVVHVGGDAPRTAAVSVPVLRQTEVVATIGQPVLAPGESVSVTLRRRKSAARVPVIVELLDSRGLIEAHLIAAGANKLTLKAPLDRLGVIQVRARPLRQRGVVEGTGGGDAFIVRPRRPSFPLLSTDRKLYPIKGTARLTVATTAGAAKSWAAVLVRDLAAHGGESGFSFQFLNRSFDRAILDPNSKASQMLLRTALAAHVFYETAPTEAPPLLDELGEPLEGDYGLEQTPARGVLRDPFPLADELARRGIGDSMRKLEALLARALAEGRLSDITTGSGRKRSFKANVLDELEDVQPTLGDGKLTLAMLYAADRSFTYDNVARRVARLGLVNLLVGLAHYLDPGDDASPRQRVAAREPHDRWLPRMVEQGLIDATQLADPWGGSFTLRRNPRPLLAIAVEAANLELVSPGPDGKLGTTDDLRDPFARVVPAGTPYAIASGEDRLMKLLARLSPGEEVLKRLQEAYRRVTAEVAEEETGDAVSASFSEGRYGSIGHGGGTGSGYGSGSGHGRLGGRRSVTPKVRMGSASATGSGIRSFARVMRERFPPTLLFAPALELDPSGKTEVEIKLSEAVTTYLVEVVVWSSDGWSWSNQTRIRVDKETVIDAPIPGYATVGDKLNVPVRVGNRTPKDRKLTVAVFVPGQPDSPLVERSGITVPAGDSVEVPVELELPRATDGKVTVGVRSAQGTALDAVRRPIVVYSPTRRVRRSVDILASGAGRLDLEVPKRATPRQGAEVTVRVGAGMFAIPDGPWSEWTAAWTDNRAVGSATMEALRNASGATLARAVGTAWGMGRVSDDALERGLEGLTRTLDELAASSGDARSSALREQVQILLFLAPATRQVGARSDLASNLEAVLRSLRKEVESNIAQAGEDPHHWALTAAALALTAPAQANLDRVGELVRRVRRNQLQVGNQTWVATRTGGHATSALLALAELRLGEPERALALLRTLGRLNIDGRAIGGWALVLARVGATLMSKGKPADQVSLSIDGVVKVVAIENGIVRIPAPSLARPGAHHIRIDNPGPTPTLYHVEAKTEYGLPWDIVPTRPGSLEVTIEGKSKGRDQRAELELVVRNRSPRAIASPTLEISLPAGVELDEEARAAIRARTVGEPDATRGTLRLQLGGLPPGGKRRIPLPLRWSVGGSLQGLGIAAYPADRPEDLSILPPRVWKIEEVRP